MTTQSGLPLKKTYTPEDLENAGWTYEKQLGDAGSYPFTRGPHESMYLGR